MTKLTEAQVQEVQEKYRAGGITQQELADEYGIGQWNISRIMNGKGPHSQFRKVDAIDRQILRCIERQEGLSMIEVYRCYNLESDEPRSEQFIRYRLNSLAEMNEIRIVRVKGRPAIRRCYIASKLNAKQLRGRVRDGNDG
jgi:hypothetical protein